MIATTPAQLALRPVVVVDDDDVDRELIAWAYRRTTKENEFIAFADGPSFLEYLDDVDPAGVPALVLLDIDMPRMDGFAVMERLLSMPVHQQVGRVVFYSNSDNPRDEDRAEALGASLQQKFVDLHDAVGFLERMLSSP